MKARIEARDRFYYPDVMVTCDPRDQAHRHLQALPQTSGRSAVSLHRSL
jgi:hypothetical protein